MTKVYFTFAISEIFLSGPSTKRLLQDESSRHGLSRWRLIPESTANACATAIATLLGARLKRIASSERLQDMPGERLQPLEIGFIAISFMSVSLTFALHSLQPFGTKFDAATIELHSVAYGHSVIALLLLIIVEFRLQNATAATNGPSLRSALLRLRWLYVAETLHGILLGVDIATGRDLTLHFYGKCRELWTLIAIQNTLNFKHSAVLYRIRSAKAKSISQQRGLLSIQEKLPESACIFDKQQSEIQRKFSAFSISEDNQGTNK